MPATKLIDRTEPVVAPRAHTTATARSRLPWLLRVPILVVLNAGIRSMLWTAVLNFLVPELGKISKVPTEEDFWSLYSLAARIAMNAVTVSMHWYFNYDFYDVAALTVLTNTPYAYLVMTYYEISALTVAAYMWVEVLAITVPTYLMRPRSAAHRSNVPLRNRYLLNSVQVQATNAMLAVGVYIFVLWVSLRTKYLHSLLVTYFDIRTLESAYASTPVTILAKVLVPGVAAKEFLLNPSIAAQPLPGTETPVEGHFNPATATLDETIKANILPADRRKKTLAQQTIVLNAFLFVSTVQRCMTIDGTELKGAAGYSALWVAANTLLSMWFSWVGDTSADYEPL